MINLKEEMSNINYYQQVIDDNEEKRKDLEFDTDFNKVLKFIMNPNFKWSIPRRVSIPKSTPGKFRDIFIFDDKESFYLKVVNEILFAKCSNYLSPIVYSYRKGVRCLDAAKVVLGYLNNSKCYGAKVDISNYFMNVNKSTISKYVNSLIEDNWGRELLMKLFNIKECKFRDTIENKYMGIMPGCAISAFFANICLKDIDNFLLSNTECCCRYGDDIVFFCKSYNDVNIILENLNKLLSNLGLSFNKDKVELYNNPNKVEFLGLEVKRDGIDISDKTFIKYKNTIKSICSKYKKCISLNSRNKDDYIKKCIYSINNLFFRQGVLYDLKGDRARFMFGNITKVCNIKLLDFYTRDRLRQAYTGKNNSSNISKLPIDKLKSLGYHSFGDMYNLWCIGNDIYNNVTYCLNEEDKAPRYIGTPFSLKEHYISETIEFKNFCEFYKYCSKNLCKFCIGDMYYSFYSLSFDIVKKLICIGNVVICRNNKMEVNSITVIDKDGVMKDFIINNQEIGSDTILDEDLLLKLYLDYSFKNSVLSIRKEVIYPRLFRAYRFEDLYDRFGINLNIEAPLEFRESNFYCYLYVLCVSGKIDELYKSRERFRILKKYDFSLVLDKNIINSEKFIEDKKLSLFGYDNIKEYKNNYNTEDMDLF